VREKTFLFFTNQRWLGALRCAPLWARRLICGQTGAAALLYFRGNVAHGLLRDDLAFAAADRSLRIVERCQEFRPLALALLPQ